MTNQNKTKFLIGIFLILVTTFLVSADYSVATPQLTAPGLNSFNYNYGTSVQLAPDVGACEKGQDFIIQVAPFGCTPIPVRSDLLEEQNVPVFCQLAATQINPLIKVNAIEYISFKGDMPEGVSGVGFHPAKAAISSSRGTMLNSPVLENIGYAVIVLEKQKNESSMPDFVEGTLTANIRYDVQNTFGIGKVGYYLPELTQTDWEQKFNQYGFWRNKGYLRAESIGDNSATIGVYTNTNNKISTTTLSKGQTSGEISLPGFYCLAGMQLRLDSLENPDTRAKFNINGDIVEVAEREQFLENRCSVTDIEKQGLIQEISVKCKDDKQTENFNLRISPRIILEINGQQKEAEVGDYLYTSADKSKAVYLGYVGTQDSSENIEKSYIQLMAKPIQTSTLGSNELIEVSRFDELTRGSETSIGVVNAALDLSKLGLKGAISIQKYLGSGKEFRKIKYSEETEFNNQKVKIIGFASPTDKKFEGNISQIYESAMADYRKIIDSFPNTKEKDHLKDTTQKTEKLLEENTFGEQAFFNAIQLAKNTEQKKTMLSLCKEFKEKFSDSKTDLSKECDDEYKNSNKEFSTRNILINNQVKSMSFEGIYEPSIEEFSATVKVTGLDKKIETYELTKNTPIFLSNETNDFFELKDLNSNTATITIDIPSKTIEGKIQKAITSKDTTLKKNEGVGVGGYIFTLTDIKLKKVAKVSVLPKIDNAGTQTNFSFNIGIEKRAIQLAPDEINDRIEDLDGLIKDWSKISNDLGNTVKTFNAACLSTGIILTAKNFFDNTGGRSIARNKVMRGEGGWTDICREKVGEKEYSSMNDCLLANSTKIDADVDKRYEAMQDIKITEENKSAETAELAKSYDGIIIDPRNPKNIINTTDINSEFNKLGENNTILISQTRDLKAIENALAKNPSAELKTALEIERYKILSEINSNVQGSAIQASFAETLNAQSGLKNINIRQYGRQDAIQGVYDGGTTTQESFGEINATTPVQAIVYNNKKYLLELEKISANEYTVVNVYDANGKKLLETRAETEFDKLHSYDINVREIKERFTGFKEYDKGTYQNKFKDPQVKYFETEPYKGMPAQVPFDLQNGWYATMKQTLAGGGSIRTYDASGAVSSFYLCNVGENGKAEFNSGIRDDICQGYNPGTGQIVGEFSGLTKSETDSLVRKAISSINEAQSRYKAGVSSVLIGKQNIPVGNPEVGVPEMQCQDFMSPSDCNLLFNVCDPVVCPSSRCNMGGTYHSSNVIQSGIIGSIALCLPNMKENIFVPICLSGLKAGIDMLLSSFEGYRTCLQTQLDSGETIGICDELHSIYLCEFFWREALPFAETIIPRIFESLTGQGGTRGGGEYLGVQTAWDNAQGSVNYMSDYYGRDITNAFKLKLTQEVGGEVCKSFISANYPAGGEVLDSLIEPASPPQYTANFNEIPFTTATVPATSQYKVYYHIYAGKESKVFYRVYLKSPSGTSLYQTSPTLEVASGFINKDGSADETRDFTAPTGYKELCINVNGQDNCGFKQVSTSFAVDYVNDKYLQEQASRTDIKSQEECISGSPSLYSLAQPNLQEGISEGINPALYDRGIIRICGTSNPGQGTDANINTADARWQKVGNCDGERGDLKCWLDTQSVKDVIKTTSLENETLGDVSGNYIKQLEDEGGYLDFGQELEIINKLDSKGKTNYITNTLVSKAFFNNQKAKLYLIRGNAYSDLAFSNFIYQEVTRIINELGISDEKVDMPKTNEETDKEITKEIPKDLDTIFSNCQGQYPGQCEVAKKIVELARVIKSSKNIEDSIIKKDTDANCFEELVLQVAMQESKISHCKNELWKGKSFENDFTCDDNTNNVLGSSDGLSTGIMQINTKVHTKVNALIFESNTNYGINYLIENYNSGAKEYLCADKIYSGWTRSLRYYNGWNTNCSKGDVNYVENVLSEKDKVRSLFGNVCETSTTQTTQTGKEIGALKLTEGSTKYPIFEIQDSYGLNLYYIYSDTGGWFWSIDKENYESDDWNKVGEFLGLTGIMILSDDEDFIKKLGDKNYQEGLELLIKETDERNSGAIFFGRNVELATEKVLYEPTGIQDKLFTIYREGQYNIQLRKEPSNWQYQITMESWKDVSKISEDSERTQLTQKEIDLIKSLEGKDYFTGARIIFSVDESKADLKILEVYRIEDSYKLNDQEKQVVLNAKICDDCGNGAFNNCDEIECSAINQMFGGNKCKWDNPNIIFYECIEYTKYNYKTALDKINSEKLTGSYYKNRHFFTQLLEDGILTPNENYDFFESNKENDINNLKILLEKKLEIVPKVDDAKKELMTTVPKGPTSEEEIEKINEAINEINELSKEYALQGIKIKDVKYSNDFPGFRNLIDKICKEEIFKEDTIEKCGQIKEITGFGNEDLEHIIRLLEIQKTKEKYAITTKTTEEKQIEENIEIKKALEDLFTLRKAWGNADYGDYNEVDRFIDKLCEERIFGEYTKEECDEIRGTGVGPLRVGEEDLDYVEKLLERDTEERTEEEKILAIEKALEDLFTLRKAWGNADYGDYNEVDNFIDELCWKKIFGKNTGRECDEIRGTGVGPLRVGEEDLDYVRFALEIQKGIELTEEEISAIKEITKEERILVIEKALEDIEILFRAWGNADYGDYNEVDRFIDKLCEERIFGEYTKEECDEIRGTGVGPLRVGEEDLEYIRNSLRIQKLE